MSVPIESPYATFMIMLVVGVRGGGLGAAYAVHFRLIEKRVVDFLLMIIEFFSL